MITYKDIIEAQETIVENWGEVGKKIIERIILHETPFEGKSKDFLDNCVACGGDWGHMLLSGIKELYPVVWDMIPDEMGRNTFVTLCSVLLLLGVDTSE